MLFPFREIEREIPCYCVKDQQNCFWRKSNESKTLQRYRSHLQIWQHREFRMQQRLSTQYLLITLSNGHLAMTRNASESYWLLIMNETSLRRADREPAASFNTRWTHHATAPTSKIILIPHTLTFHLKPTNNHYLPNTKCKAPFQYNQLSSKLTATLVKGKFIVSDRSQVCWQNFAVTSLWK